MSGVRLVTGVLAGLAVVGLAACDSGSNGGASLDDVAVERPDEGSAANDDDDGPAGDAPADVPAEDGRALDGDAEDQPAGGDAAVDELLARSPDRKITICHRTNGSSPWVEITVDENSIGAHLNHPWGDDIIPAPPEGCPDDGGTTTTSSETTAPATTEPEPTTTPPGLLPTTTVPTESTTTAPGLVTTVPPTAPTESTTTAPGLVTTVPPTPETTLPPSPATSDPVGVLPTVGPPDSTAPPTPPTSDPGGSTPSSSVSSGGGGQAELPGTGDDTTGWLGLTAGALLAAGLALVRLARRPAPGH